MGKGSNMMLLRYCEDLWLALVSRKDVGSPTGNASARPVCGQAADVGGGLARMQSVELPGKSDTVNACV
jgi:hypothetical protein